MAGPSVTAAHIHCSYYISAKTNRVGLFSIGDIYRNQGGGCACCHFQFGCAIFKRHYNAGPIDFCDIGLLDGKQGKRSQVADKSACVFACYYNLCKVALAA